MEGGQVMVVLIVAIVMFSGIIRAKMGLGSRRGRRNQAEYGIRDDSAVAAENHRLRSEITDLRERVQILERVVTDNEGSLRLDREIEKLRDARRD
jgi:hypothetical protein